MTSMPSTPGTMPSTPGPNAGPPLPLIPCVDATAAGWISDSGMPWAQLVGFGPEGFPGHARLRFIPDPNGAGESESEAGTDTGGLSETERLAVAVAVLRQHTTTPNELFFAFWDGHGLAMPAARFDVPNREYFLYSGTVTADGQWDIAAADQAPGQQWLPDPAFIWPADHSWCIANDVDPHWAGVGGSLEALRALGADERLDMVPANPAEPQPAYY